MKEAVECDILKGGPYGGVAFLINNNTASKAKCVHKSERYIVLKMNKKAVLPQGNRAMPQVFFSVEVRQQHSIQV